MYKVYKIRNIINNHCYIGMTKTSLTKRFLSHKYASKFTKNKLYSAFKKYSVENFVIELIQSFDNKEECIENEIFYIEKEGYYNLAKGGEGGFVVQYVEEWKNKLKKSRKNRKPALGMKHSETNKKLFKECSKKYWETQSTYKWEDIENLTHKEAKIKLGISTTHYYRLKKQNGQPALNRSDAAKKGWKTKIPE